MANVNAYSTGVGPTGESLQNNRRIFNFGDRVAELAPMQSPFFVYLSKVAKKATDDPVFKFLEQRHQWQRRNFRVETAYTNKNWTAGTAEATTGDDLKIHCGALIVHVIS